MAVESERDEDVYQSSSKFPYHSLTQTIFEMTQFRMPCGTFDPL